MDQYLYAYNYRMLYYDYDVKYWTLQMLYMYVLFYLDMGEVTVQCKRCTDYQATV